MIQPFQGWISIFPESQGSAAGATLGYRMKSRWDLKQLRIAEPFEVIVFETCQSRTTDYP
jgi:hypothetical protein